MTTIDTVTSEAETFAPSVAENIASPSATKFATYCKERDIRQVMVLIPNTLGDMLRAVETRDSIKESDLVRNILGSSVNFYALTHIQYVEDNPEWDYVAPWTYTPPAPREPVSAAKKLTAANAKIAEQASELEALKAQLAAMQKMMATPTPPTIHADPKTGKLVAS